MALKVKKINRKVDLNSKNNDVFDLPANWQFTIDSKDSGPMKFDLSFLLKSDRLELATQIRDALWNLRYESETASLKTYHVSIKRFWRFLDELDATGNYIKKLNQIDRKFIDQYITWLDLQVIPMSHKNRGQQLSPQVRRTLYSGLKAILINRQKFAPNEVNKNLAFPWNPFPNSSRNFSNREPYSPSEHKRILSALNKDLEIIHKDPNELPPLQVLVTYLLH